MIYASLDDRVRAGLKSGNVTKASGTIHLQEGGAVNSCRYPLKGSINVLLEVRRQRCVQLLKTISSARCQRSTHFGHGLAHGPKRGGTSGWTRNEVSGVRAVDARAEQKPKNHCAGRSQEGATRQTFGRTLRFRGHRAHAGSLARWREEGVSGVSLTFPWAGHRPGGWVGAREVRRFGGREWSSTVGRARAATSVAVATRALTTGDTWTAEPAGAYTSTRTLAEWSRRRVVSR